MNKGYPMYVISLSNLKKLNRFMKHEDIFQLLNRVECHVHGLGKHELQTPNSQQINYNNFYFISHRWSEPNKDTDISHPDNVNNSKLKSLVSYLEIIQKKRNIEEMYIWFDYLSIPQ